MNEFERIPLTFAQIEAKVRELVANNPNYVYPADSASHYSCTYNQKSTPPCIFGRAFIELGYPVPNFLEGTGIVTVLNRLLQEMENTALSPENTQWAMALQSYQDRGSTWSAALAHADKVRAQWMRTQ